MRAAEQLLGGAPATMEYHFPTGRGENGVVGYPCEALGEGEAVLRALLDIAFAGLFVATEDTADCRYCDYAAICRAGEDDWGKMTSAPAEWSRERGMEKPEYEPLRMIREIDG